MAPILYDDEKLFLLDIMSQIVYFFLFLYSFLCVRVSTTVKIGKEEIKTNQNWLVLVFYTYKTKFARLNNLTYKSFWILSENL